MYGGAPGQRQSAPHLSLIGTLDVLGRLSGRIGTLSGEPTGTGGAASALVGSPGPWAYPGSLYGGGELDRKSTGACHASMTGTPGAVGVLSGAL